LAPPRTLENPPDPVQTAAMTARRTRVVIASVATRVPRQTAAAELAEQTGVGDALLRGLIRAQLALALRLAVVVLVCLGSLPLLFAVAPRLGAITILGARLPWLLLGLAAYPFLIAVGVVFVRGAARNEQDFAALVKRR
jgi:hypothetical protein